jgi:hypothetical protein
MTFVYLAKRYLKEIQVTPLDVEVYRIEQNALDKVEEWAGVRLAWEKIEVNEALHFWKADNGMYAYRVLMKELHE